MKQLSILASVLSLGLATAGVASAQSTTSALIGATIEVPISIVRTANLDFGRAAGSATPGTIVMAAVDGGITETGGAWTVGGVASRATFTVTGEPSRRIAITLPIGQIELSANAGVNHMYVDTFVSSPTPDLPETDGTGSLTLYVGATLRVGGGQVAGVYSGTFNVTVNYN